MVAGGDAAELRRGRRRPAALVAAGLLGALALLCVAGLGAALWERGRAPRTHDDRAATVRTAGGMRAYLSSARPTEAILFERRERGKVHIVSAIVDRRSGALPPE